jgi:hypothetical protein
VPDWVTPPKRLLGGLKSRLSQYPARPASQSREWLRVPDWVTPPKRLLGGLKSRHPARPARQNREREIYVSTFSAQPIRQNRERRGFGIRLNAPISSACWDVVDPIGLNAAKRRLTHSIECILNECTDWYTGGKKINIRLLYIPRLRVVIDASVLGSLPCSPFGNRYYF